MYLTIFISALVCKKAEIEAPALSAHKMNSSVIESTEEQNRILKEDYCKTLAEVKIPDPK